MAEVKKEESDRIDLDSIPDSCIKALAEDIYPMMVAFYESEEGQRIFEEWKRERGVTEMSER